jgi:hypothetical protein
MSSKQREEPGDARQSSRRRFLKQGAAFACATAASIKAASAQGPEDPNQRTDYVPEEQVPKDRILRDPWSGEMMRDEEGLRWRIGFRLLGHAHGAQQH